MPLTNVFSRFFIFFEIFIKKSRKYLRGIKNDYIFAMISEMKYKNNKNRSDYGIKSRT